MDITSTNTNVYFSTPDDPNDYVQAAQVLAVAPSGPAGILRPGQSGQLTLTLLDDDTVNGDQIPIQVSQIEAGPDHRLGRAGGGAPAHQHSDRGLERHLRQSARHGRHHDRFLQRRPGPGRDLPRQPRRNHGPGQRRRPLWSFLVSQADAAFPTTTLTSAVDASLPTPGSLSLAIDRTFVSSIAGRSTPGIFGLGWTTSWQTSLSVDSAGNVTIDSGGDLGYFPIQANGTYLDTDGEYGSLTKSGGIYTFTSTSGTQYVFLPTAS